MMLHNVEFVILTNGRTGSTALESRLNTHPEIRCQHELLSPTSRKKFGHEMDLSTEDKLNKFFDHHLDSQERFQGFRMLYGQLQLQAGVMGYTFAKPSHVSKTIQNRGMRVVHLIRQNFLDLCLSIELSRKKGLWAVTPTVHKSERRRKALLDQYNQPVKLDVRNFLDNLEKYKASQEVMRGLFDPFELEYDSIFSDLHRLQEWLGCNPVELGHPKTLRQRRLPKDQLIDNYREVVELLKGTEHEWMLGLSSS
jgi:LPS sulfotransferase NodH